eukprot:jgi/Mesvir1/7325/Mv19137-RA.1
MFQSDDTPDPLFAELEALYAQTEVDAAVQGTEGDNEAQDDYTTFVDERDDYGVLPPEGELATDHGHDGEDEKWRAKIWFEQYEDPMWVNYMREIHPDDYQDGDGSDWAGSDHECDRDDEGASGSEADLDKLEFDARSDFESNFSDGPSVSLGASSCVCTDCHIFANLMDASGDLPLPTGRQVTFTWARNSCHYHAALEFLYVVLLATQTATRSWLRSLLSRPAGVAHGAACKVGVELFKAMAAAARQDSIGMTHAREDLRRLLDPSMARQAGSMQCALEDVEHMMGYVSRGHDSTAGGAFVPCPTVLRLRRRDAAIDAL